MENLLKEELEKVVKLMMELEPLKVLVKMDSLERDKKEMMTKLKFFPI